MDKRQKKKYDKYTDQQSERGMVRAYPYIPVELRDEFMELAKLFREVYKGDISKTKFLMDARTVLTETVDKIKP